MDPCGRAVVMIVLGIDAGGSKTHAVLADEGGRVLGAGTAGGANWELAGLDGARASLASAVRRAVRSAGIRKKAIAAAGIGIAGLDWPDDEEPLQTVIESAGISVPRVLVNDVFLILRAGTRDGTGVAVIGGTGSAVVGRNRHGKTERSLGAGYPFTDWGGSGDMVAAAIHAVARSHMELGPHTVLTERMLEATGASDPADLLEKLMRWRVLITGGFALEVIRAAEEGDGAARSIVTRAGKIMGENATFVARRLKMLRTAFPLVTSGGVFSSRSTLLCDTLLETVCSAAPRVELRHWSFPPVVGALLLALDLKNPDRLPDAEVLGDQVAKTLKQVEKPS
jgi:N-acetylglucosamine kinase-like BadF-type ATPase